MQKSAGGDPGAMSVPKTPNPQPPSPLRPLKEALKARGLVLLFRAFLGDGSLKTNCAPQTQNSKPSTAPHPQPLAQESAGGDPGAMSVPQLKEALKARGLKVAASPH